MKYIIFKIFKYLAAMAFSLVFLSFASFFYFVPEKNPVFGINFSPDQARYMGYDALNMFEDMLADLKPKKIRLTAYWENIEKEPGRFDFRETDSLIAASEKAGAKVILVLGHKQPRWPECHHPSWYESLDKDKQKEALFGFISAVLGRYKDSPAVERWQVENEPFFNYGKNCPVLEFSALEEEILLVKNNDKRPVVVTDSGEKGGWFSAYKAGDVFGTTMYRTVHNPRYGGYVTYPLPPAWYRVRAGLVQFLYGRKPILGIELQAEPWFNGNVHEIPPEEQVKIFSPEDFKNNIAYAKKTGLAEHLFWGAEWWYFIRDRGYPEFWEEAKNLF